MKEIKILILLLIIFSSQSSIAQRTKELLNFDWKYAYGDFPEAIKTDFNDSNWGKVNLPHDASIAGPFVKDSLNSDRKNGFLPRRKGWYRKSLDLSKSTIGHKIFLEFEGIYRDARVYVNGEEVAHQLNGFEGFLADITQVAKVGENTIAVSYDNTDKGSSRWYNGEGIYRNVWLLVTDKIHVNYNGTFISTPYVSKEKAKINIETEFLNESKEKKNILVTSIIYSPDKKNIGKITNVIRLSAGESYTCKQQVLVSSPQLWNLDHPNLYQIKTVLSDDGKELDNYHTDFGIRTIEFNRDEGMLLNGEKVFINGVNLHDDLGPLGAASFKRGIERRLEGLKALGCNGIRLSHNPHDKAVLDWCDKNGMLIFDEAFDNWANEFFGAENNFEYHWKSSLEAFVKRDRNHPSVFVWSVGNEVSQQRTENAQYGVPQLKKMVDFVHQLDPSRKVTCGLFPAREKGARNNENFYKEGPPEMEFYMDVVSVNYREEFWPADRKQYPQLTFMESEASVANLGNEWFNMDHRSSIGIFYWGGTDYIGESFGWPSKGWASGIIDWDDHWKGFSYYINSLFSEKPMVHIAIVEENKATEKYWNDVALKYQPLASHWNWRKGDTLKVLTFSNCQEVEFFVNGKSLGIKKVPETYYTKDVRGYTAEEFSLDPRPSGPEMHNELKWAVPYETGDIKVLGYINKKVVATHQLKTAGKPSKIILEGDRNKIKADGLDLSYITVKVVDDKGILVPDADQNITFTVKGAGVNQGLGSADMTSNKSFVSNQRKVFQGKALLVVRSTRESGSIEIDATAKGLKKGMLKIEAVK